MCCAVPSQVLLFATPMNYSPQSSSVYGDFPGKNTGMGCHVPLQRIFPTRGWNPGLPHCRQILYHLNHQGSPRILEWVAYHFFGWSSWSRNETRVSCIAGGFFSSWATREALCCLCVLSHFSRVQLFVIPLAVAHQASLSIGFSRQEY